MLSCAAWGETSLILHRISQKQWQKALTAIWGMQFLPVVSNCSSTLLQWLLCNGSSALDNSSYRYFSMHVDDHYFQSMIGAPAAQSLSSSSSLPSLPSSSEVAWALIINCWQRQQQIEQQSEQKQEWFRLKVLRYCFRCDTKKSSDDGGRPYVQQREEDQHAHPVLVVVVAAVASVGQSSCQRGSLQLVGSSVT